VDRLIVTGPDESVPPAFSTFTVKVAGAAGDAVPVTVTDDTRSTPAAAEESLSRKVVTADREATTRPAITSKAVKLRLRCERRETA
jgi:hypothetical protein